jgi:hypothetical protein
MVSSFVMVNLVNWHCGVNNVGLNNLLLNNGLDGLVNMLEHD